VEAVGAQVEGPRARPAATSIAASLGLGKPLMAAGASSLRPSPCRSAAAGRALAPSLRWIHPKHYRCEWMGHRERIPNIGYEMHDAIDGYWNASQRENTGERAVRAEGLAADGEGDVGSIGTVQQAAEVVPQV
jgi:hypothetical protein